MIFGDFWSSVKAQLYERAASPLLGTFAGTWLIWNYRLVVVIFSDLEIANKFGYIDSVLYPGTWEPYLHLLVYPLISAAVVISLYPIPARWAYRYWRREKKLLRDIKQEIEGSELLSLDESRSLREALITREIELQGRLDYKDKEIAERDKRIVELEESLKGHAASIDKDVIDGGTFGDIENDPDVSEEQLQILEHAANKGREKGIEIYEIESFTQMPRAKLDYLLDGLTSKKLLKSSWEDGGFVYTSTELGRKLLAALRRI